MFTVQRRHLACFWILCGLAPLYASGCASGPPPASTTAMQSISMRYPDPDPRYLPPKKQDDSSWGWFSSKAVAESYNKMLDRNPNHDVARQYFAAADTLFVQTKYDDAAPLFAKAAVKWPDSPLEEDAFFYEAECQFFTDRYSHANDSYSELLKKYPSSRYLDRAIARQFAIADYWEKSERANPHWVVTPNFTDKTRPWFDTEGNALALWDHVRLKDPTGPLADSAIMATGNAHFLNGHWEEADYYYTLLRKDYPKSKFQVQAHLLDLQCKLKKYQGPEYDGTPLKEADQLVDQMLRQFPNELQGERERLLAAKTDVRGQLAYRDLLRAEFYAKNDYYGAARVYYASIVKDYPNSNAAQLAQERINSYKDQPDHPPDRLAFVKNVFGGKSDAPIMPLPPATADTNIATTPSTTGTTQR